MPFDKYDAPILKELAHMCEGLTPDEASCALSFLPICYARLNPIVRSSSTILNFDETMLKEHPRRFYTAVLATTFTVSAVTMNPLIGALSYYAAGVPCVIKAHHVSIRQRTVASRISKLRETNGSRNTDSQIVNLLLLSIYGIDRDSMKFTLTLICMTLLQLRHENLKLDVDTDNHLNLLFSRFVALESQFAKNQLTPEMVVALATPRDLSASRSHEDDWEIMRIAIEETCKTYISSARSDSEKHMAFFSETALPLFRARKLAARLPGLSVINEPPYFSFDLTSLKKLCEENVDHAVIQLLTSDDGKAGTNSFKNILISNLSTLVKRIAQDTTSYLTEPLYVAGMFLREYTLRTKSLIHTVEDQQSQGVILQ